jgi:hypothetical protein
MTDFLGRLVQRSLPTVERSGSRAELAPCLPGLFEPTGGEVIAPANSESSAGQPASAARQNMQVTQGPHPSVMPQARMSAWSTASHPEPAPRKISDTDQRHESDRSRSASTLQPSVVRQQVIRHEPEHSSAPNEYSLQTLPSARFTSVLHTNSGPNRQSQRLENTAAMIEGSSQTTVRINIGRIEVRAVQPAQPVAPTRRTVSQAKMTIEEYAKQRNEGK